MVLQKILKALRPLRNRMHANTALQCIFTGVGAAGLLAFVTSLVALFIPIPYLFEKLILIYAVCCGISVILSIVLRPGLTKVIKTADGMGLKERVITAFQLKEDSSSISFLQREDTLKAVSQVNFKALYRIRLPYVKIAASIGFILLIAVTFAMPTASKQKAAKYEAFKKEAVKQAESIDKVRKQEAKASKLPDKKLEELNKKIDALLKELKKAETEAEGIKALSKAKHELEKLKKDMGMEGLAKMAENLGKNALTKELDQAVKNGYMADIKQKLEKLGETMKNLAPEDKKQLADALKKASENMAEQKELSKALSALSEAAASGNAGAAKESTQAMGNALARLTQGNMNGSNSAGAQGNQALNRMMNSINEARYSLASQGDSGDLFAQQQNMAGDGDSQGSGEGSQGDPSGEGEQGGEGGQGEGQGEGQGNGGGQGQGQGQGQGGGGAGEGSSSKDAGYTGFESGGGSKLPGTKKEKEYERIYAPERLGGSNQSSQVKGQIGKSGQSQWSEASNVPVNKGNAIPYNEVFEQYKGEAMTNMKDSAVPPVMKDIVRDYFSSLE